MMEIVHVGREDLLDLVQRRAHLDAIASICILTRFDNPNIINVRVLLLIRLLVNQISFLVLFVAQSSKLNRLIMNYSRKFRARSIVFKFAQSAQGLDSLQTLMLICVEERGLSTAFIIIVR
jgi:hypothetical protein